ncbi:MAG: molybdopterin cofactor-binding domain-containing protein [Acetobacterium sp.]|uniref:xanthine dehydrogenase family protein molybdopterin-binding subunit n=1 Tax=Acetobacterium sp. TaxID=1872094 RepID=UPI003242A945
MSTRKPAVNRPVPKKDALALLTGQPVYTEDLAPKDCLVVKLLRSPHPHARIQAIDTEAAAKIPGIFIFTYRDVPQKRFTLAGQSFPEPSPYDRLILDQTLRFVGDAVAIVAGETEKAVDQALRRIRVDYQLLEPVLDFRTARDHPVIIHPEDNWQSLMEVGADPRRNLCAHGEDRHGDVEAVLRDCAVTLEQTYHTKANQQVMMETFRSFTYLDAYGRLNCVTSTQIPFHVRRILAHALDLPKAQIRVIKPRVGGGFGSKQTAVSQIYPALVTLKTGKPAMLIYSRRENQTASSPRHEMEITVRLGADQNGVIKAIDMQVLSNTGAYGDHGPTTVVLTGHKAIPLYGKTAAYRFGYDVVYTNKMSAGAYRGYGATQGIFALESAVNELAAKMNRDPVQIRELNQVKSGDVMPGYFNETLGSCSLDRCLKIAKEMISWDQKYPRLDLGNGKVRSVVVAMAMQGSGIAQVDTASVTLTLSDDGFYSLRIGAADMGTGCDTVLVQMAADCLLCPEANIVVSGVDTDYSPYDTGSYASSTTYVTGMAVVNACEKLIKKITAAGARHLGCAVEAVDFDGEQVEAIHHNAVISLKALANQSLRGNHPPLSVTASFSSPISPPPFMVGMAEVEIDTETGVITLLDYVAVVDCGTVINTSLARVQVEGGLAQGIGMALYEDIHYNAAGRVSHNSLLQYKIPSRLDLGQIRVAFESSYEATGPFGAKSIGEIVINTPAPAIANAVYNGVGVQIRELPITAEKIYRGIHDHATAF